MGRQGTARWGATIGALCALLAIAPDVSAAGPERAGRAESRVARYARIDAEDQGWAWLLELAEDAGRTDEDRGAAIRALGGRPVEGALAPLRRLAAAGTPSVAAAAAGVLLRWGHRDEALAMLAAAQEKGAPVRIPLRTAFDRGTWSYAAGARALFESGLDSSHVTVRLDAAAGLLELGVRPREAHATIRQVALKAPRFDDRVAALLTVAAAPIDADTRATLAAALTDSDDRVARTARHLLSRLPAASPAVTRE